MRTAIMDPRGDLAPAGLDLGARSATRFAQAVLLIGFFYLAYRYPFQINSSDTSPTYSDTPMWLQVGKYILLLAIAVLFVIHESLSAHSRKRGPATESPWHSLATVWLGCIGAFVLAKGLLVGAPEMASSGLEIAAAVALLISARRSSVDFSRLAKTVILIAVVAIIVDAVQYALFVTDGRLPALAYEGSVSVRFGSVIDDPNGMGLLISLLLPVVWIALRGLPRVLLAVGLLAVLFLTQSLTAAASLFVAVFITALASRASKPGRAYVMVVGGVVAVGVAYLFVSTSSQLDLFLESKQGSVAARGDRVDAFASISALDLLGMSDTAVWNEISYVHVTRNFGLLVAVGFFGLGLYSAVALLRRGFRTSERYARASTIGFGTFQIAFLVGSANLQLQGVFPVALFYLVGIALAFTPTLARSTAWSPSTVSGKQLRLDTRFAVDR